MKSADGKDSTRVNIATLKAQLAKYLRLVRSGRSVIVTDHRLPVARLVPFEGELVFQTIQPEVEFSKFARREIPALENKDQIDTLAFLQRERGNR
jgi:prevent-host-death family protein